MQPNTITKCIEESQLLHPNNIAFDHNQILINIVMRNTHIYTTLIAFNLCINFSQFQDHIFIISPINTPNLILSTKKCNPYKDIVIAKTIIQTHGLEANIFDQTWAYIKTTTISSLQCYRKDSTKLKHTPWLTSCNRHHKTSPCKSSS